MEDRVGVVGHLRSTDYHKAKYILQMLAERHPQMFKNVAFEELMEFQWVAKLNEIRHSVKNNTERLLAEEATEAAVFVNDCISWTTSGLIKWVIEEGLLPEIQESLKQMDFQVMSDQAYQEYIKNNEFVFVYMKVSVESELLGQLTLQLFRELCPKTVENFVALCKGVMLRDDITGPVISYTGTNVHRVVPGGWIQGGDISTGSPGSGGVSIYGETFPDESYAVSHDDIAGILGMANKGRNTNASQFYITLKPSSWMDGQYVGFGRVVEGSAVLKAIESLDTHNERPAKRCYISECGVICS